MPHGSLGHYPRLVRLALRKLRGTDRRLADEEDVALSPLDSFCRAAAQGRFPQLSDRDDLWGLLIVITERTAREYRRHARRQKRGSGRVHGESAFFSPAESGVGRPGIEQVIGREPSPAFAARMAEECQRLLSMLDNEGLRTLAICKLEGYTNEETAAKLGWALRTVERKLGLIRGIWAEELER